MTTILKYPSDLADQSTDYMLFKFYDYVPPFKAAGGVGGAIQGAGAVVTGGGATVDANQYSQSTAYADTVSSADLPQIVLYMPEDINAQYGQGWQGKGFTNIAANILRVGGLHVGNLTSDVIAGGTEAVLANAAAAAISAIPGAGSVGINDVLGGLGGKVLNPNFEVMYQGPELRNFTFRWKLVPRDTKDRDNINKIIHAFKFAMTPAYNTTTFNFLQVPNVVRFFYNKGGGGATGNEHPFLYKSKSCAITNFDVNYTPDGAYSTYTDGMMTAITISISLQEMKQIFRQDLVGNSDGKYTPPSTTSPSTY